MAFDEIKAGLQKDLDELKNEEKQTDAEMLSGIPKDELKSARNKKEIQALEEALAMLEAMSTLGPRNHS
jgi:hypothetical protein